jgi:hypothetical protein
MMIAMLSLTTSKKVTTMTAAVCVTVAVSSVVFSVRAEAIGFQAESFEAAPQALPGAPSFSPGTLRADPVRDKDAFALATEDKRVDKKDDGENDGARLTFPGHWSSSQTGSALARTVLVSSANCPLCSGVIGPILQQHAVKQDAIKTEPRVAATAPHQSVAVPIPGSLALFAAGFAGLLVWHRHA